MQPDGLIKQKMHKAEHLRWIIHKILSFPLLTAYQHSVCSCNDYSEHCETVTSLKQTQNQFTI